MATRTQSRTSNSHHPRLAATASTRNRSSSKRAQCLFVGRRRRPVPRRRRSAGAAIGFAANYGRKALMQGMEAAIGDWDEMLAAEHDLALAIFDKMLATDERRPSSATCC